MIKISTSLKIASIGLIFSSFAAALPTATDLASKMGMGINIGNTMEVPENPTAWGNTFPTAEYIKSLKDAGFGTVRIPCAWYSHTTDADSMTISTGWLDSVQTVVDMVIDNEMYAVLNSHWDNGWLENNIGTSVDPTINARQESYWTQIANKFKDYNEFLLFASANEPGMHASGLGAEHMATLNVYHETMINAVRNTGGNNSTRTIIVQALQTDESLAHKWMKDNLPTDPAGTDYMMGEFHFYPYQFSLMETDADWGKCFYYWGEGNYSTTDTEHNAIARAYASPEYVDSVFQMLNDDFPVPMIIGEFGAIKRLNTLSGENLKLHLQSRAAFYGKVAELSKKHGFVPYAWDTGDEGNGNMTIIRRQTNKFGGNVGDIVDYEVLDAMRKAYGMAPLGGNSIDSIINESTSTTDKALQITYTSQTADSVEAGTMRINLNGANWSDYNAISFDLKVSGQSDGPIVGEEYGWSSVVLFAMSGDWSWTQYELGSLESFNTNTTVQNYKIALNGAEGESLQLTDISAVQAIGINVQGTQINASLYIDNILLHKADGSVDTLENFNKSIPSIEGIATGKLVVANSSGTNPIKGVPTFNQFMVNVEPGVVHASFYSQNSGKAQVSIMNGLGQVIARENRVTKAGSNSLQLKNNYKGPAYLMIEQGSLKLVRPLILK